MNSNRCNTMNVMQFIQCNGSSQCMQHNVCDGCNAMDDIHWMRCNRLNVIDAMQCNSMKGNVMQYITLQCNKSNATNAMHWMQRTNAMQWMQFNRCNALENAMDAMH